MHEWIFEIPQKLQMSKSVYRIWRIPRCPADNETNYQSHHWHLRNSQTALLAMPINYWMATQIQTCYPFKALHTGHPSYFANVSQYHKSAKSTRSSASQFIGKTFHLVLVHFIQGHQRSRTPYLLTLCIAKHSLISFTRHLKTFRLQSAYPAP